jgi:RNA polymerase sigma-70 factor (ECF subfamily)
MDPDRLRATVASAKTGQAKGYEALLRAYGPRLYGYFLRATGNHHDAEDLLGELALRLVSRLKRYEESGRFDQWLFRIAANLVRDRIRRRRTGAAGLSLEAEDASGASLADRVAAREARVDSGLLAEEASAAVQTALEKLDETTRQMILLRHFADLSFKEIAEMFGCPLGTALAKVHRGLRALRKLLDEMK